MNHGLKVNNKTLEITLPDGLDIEKVVVNGEEFVLSSAEPQKKGKWIEIKHTFFHKCSQCGWLNDVDSGYDFCPRCGVEMVQD